MGIAPVSGAFNAPEVSAWPKAGPAVFDQHTWGFTKGWLNGNWKNIYIGIFVNQKTYFHFIPIIYSIGMCWHMKHIIITHMKFGMKYERHRKKKSGLASSNEHVHQVSGSACQVVHPSAQDSQRSENCRVAFTESSCWEKKITTESARKNSSPSSAAKHVAFGEATVIEVCLLFDPSWFNRASSPSLPLHDSSFESQVQYRLGWPWHVVNVSDWFTHLWGCSRLWKYEHCQKNHLLPH